MLDVLDVLDNQEKGLNISGKIHLSLAEFIFVSKKIDKTRK